jgi:bifunctional non-homologous end joining protein LigD
VRRHVRRWRKLTPTFQAVNRLANRYPWIIETALRVRQTRFVLDGEAVVIGVAGDADFDALHSRRHDHEVQLNAFAILALEGDDLRGLPLSLRKTNLARLLRSRSEGIFLAPFERGRSVPTCSATPESSSM